MVGRGQLYSVEMAFIESEFAQRAGRFEKEERDRWMEKANEALASAQPLQYRPDGADSIDDVSDTGVVLGCRFTR